MPELPEIVVKARQMNKKLRGKRVASAESRQPKNLNISVSQFVKAIQGKAVSSVFARGKWLVVKLEPGYRLLINLGMNGDVLYFDDNREPPDRYQFRLVFDDGSGFTIAFQWIGLVHLVSEAEMSNHKMTASLGMSPFDQGFTPESFRQLLQGRKGRVKSFLLDQKNIAGIGNVYVQDILFKAKLHPNRTIPSLGGKEVESLYRSIRNVLETSINLGGLVYEKDFYGRLGRLTGAKFMVGYKTGKPCPKCGTIIQKIRTGTTSSYICPKCQAMP